MLFGIINVCGGVPTYIGARSRHDPVAFRNGFKSSHPSSSLLHSLLAAQSSLTWPLLKSKTRCDHCRELRSRYFGASSSSTSSTRSSWSLLVPSNDPNLLNSSGANTAHSPFVIALRTAEVKGLPSVFNAVITIAVLSVANSATFGSTRTFQALAQQGMVLSILAYVDKKGRPLSTVVLQIAFALLAYIKEAPSVRTQLFNWLLPLSGFQTFFIWGSICLAHIRFRKAGIAKGHSVNELPFTAIAGIYASFVGLALNVLCICAQFYVAAFPIGEGALSGSERVKGFFSAFLAVPIIFTLYVFWKVYRATSSDPRSNHRSRKLYVKLSELDVDHCIRDGILRTPEEVAAIRERRAQRTTKDKISAVPKGSWTDLLKP